MRAFWKKDSVISLKLKNDLYTLAQMANTVSKMRFFNIFKDDDVWESIDLNSLDSLFCVSVGNVVIQRLGHRRVTLDEVKPSRLPCERFFIDPFENYDGYNLRGEFLWRGGRLVDLGEGSLGIARSAPTLTPNLSLEQHREVIKKFELSGMWGAEQILNRLMRCYSTGVNQDPMKEKVFPGLHDC
jgi:hypothetical protein